MQCPVCGARLVQKHFCRYCKDVTMANITTSSNKKAKEAIKNDNRDKVVYSTYIPSDVSKKKLWILAILLGYLGIHNYYIGRSLKGLYQTVSMSVLFIFVTLGTLSDMFSWGLDNSLRLITQFFGLLAAIAVILWAFDIINLLIRRFKIPVILGEVQPFKPKKPKTTKK